jgi:uncharacterized repeat protein (TIGR01451 family)
MKVYRPNALARCVDPRFKPLVAILIALSALIAIPLFSSSLAFNSESERTGRAGNKPNPNISTNILRLAATTAKPAKTGISSRLSHHPLLALSPVQAPASEEIATFEVDTLGNCTTTPKNAFALGESVCARVLNAPAGQRQIYWIGAAGTLANNNDITQEENIFTLPMTSGSRGVWAVGDVSIFDGSALAAAIFTVSDPATPSVDLSLGMGSTLEASAGGPVSFSVILSNSGPDNAADVVLTNPTPLGTSFTAAIQNGGPSFTCENVGATTTCTGASLGKGQTASFTMVFDVAGGTPAGTIITNTAAVVNDVGELRPDDNDAENQVTVVTGNVNNTCVLDCPNNITTLANATQGGLPGAFVTFSSAEGFGDCGEISTSTPSGSFFPVGTTAVTVNSTTGGGTCGFSVTVATEGAPTISCPDDVSATAEPGESEADVTVGSPTTSPSSGVTVSGVRSDNVPLVDPVTLAVNPYPVGLTLITWRVTDANGLAASCTQRVNVNSDGCGTDTTPPTITAPADVTVDTPSGTSGSCGLVVGESQLGTADAADNCNFNVSRTGVPAGNFFPVGTTTITYTVTDGAGNQATDTQTVTVVDDTDPIIAAPADASYVCPSEVPTANPSQATRGDVLDENGNPLPPGPPIDNCGTPTVSVTENTTGAGSAADPMIITRTFTATDAANNSASAVQTITVIDSVAPTVTAPADASYQCASEVPGANPSAATSADDNCADPTVTVSDSSNGGAGTSASPLVITRTFTATDAAGNTANDDQVITVIDTTAPSLTPAAPTTASADASCQVAIPDVTAGSTASDNCGTVTKTQSPAAGTLVTLGTYTITVTATDAAGNQTTGDTSFTVEDTTAPVLSCPSNIIVYLPLNSSATSMPVSFAAPTATDNCTASPGVVTDKQSGDVFQVGTTTVNSTATDAAGNNSSCSFTVTVLYNFTGFFSPVNNLPMLNTVNAGKAIPVKFSLSGNKGLTIFAASSPYSTAINCDGTAPQSEVEETVTAGGSSLSYNASSDQYHYVWKTENSWAGTCRQLVIKLNDGSEHKANFKFR